MKIKYRVEITIKIAIVKELDKTRSTFFDIEKDYKIKMIALNNSINTSQNELAVVVNNRN